ncbi:MAG TPA: HemK/PrmC family methyltransferase [Actinomycetota bacterium]|nr:HemK/PrmC family methyltransferase [Actinomycetota bacterium]
MTEPMTVGDLLDTAERVLKDSTAIFEDHDNRREAEDLMGHCLHLDADELDLEESLPRRTREHFLSLVARRAAGEPLPILVGRIMFYGLDLKVRAGAFIPRPSSELLVARAARVLRRRKAPVVVDACTGAGPIAIALADEFPNAQVWGTDISDEGLSQGRMNARRLSLDNVKFRKGDMYGALPDAVRGTVDVVTAHVPYVPPDELDDLPREVKDFEPIYTLTDESGDGLDLMRRAIREAPDWLKPGGWLLLEMSEDISHNAQKMCGGAGFEDKGVASDNDGLSVVVEAMLPKKGPRKTSAVL